MARTTARLLRDHIASGARLMARQKVIIAELKESGVDASDVERALAQLSTCLRVFENQWLAILQKQDNL
jgi:hypothetical protein